MPIEGPPLVELTRGGRVESAHRGAMVVAGADGATVSALGDPELVCFPRSGLKPFQLLPFLEAGGADRFGFTDRELALMCSSHGGEPTHVATVSAILRKANVDAAALGCGAHPPLDAQAAAALHRAPTALHNSCSGKHAAMLAFAALAGWPLEGYLDPGHPVQVAIRAALQEVLATPIEIDSFGVDGCSAPTYAVPLRAAAVGYARLGRPAAAPERWRGALAAASRAMRAHPEMVGASTGRLDTDLMLLGRGLVAKVGAEGFFAVGSADGQALALKIADGDPSWRAHPVAAMGALAALGWLDPADLARLERHGPLVPVLSWAGRRTGELRAADALLALAGSATPAGDARETPRPTSPFGAIR